MVDTNTCHCCEGLSVQTPAKIENRPGLSAIEYRAGVYSQFRNSLLARLSLSPNNSQLRELKTRNTNDFTIGLLDAWAITSDVLTFYQERIANESYLATATERFSVLEMARMVGYELSPGVAASTHIAFTLDNTPGALGPVASAKGPTSLQEGLPPFTIAKGIKIQSIPGPDEKAQTFETINDIEVRPEWNAMKPRLTVPQFPLTEVMVFQGIDTGLKQGDILMIRGNKNPAITEDPYLRTVLKVKVDNELKTTKVELKAKPVLPKYQPPKMVFTGIFSLFLAPLQLVLKQSVVNSVKTKVWKETEFSALAKANNWSVHEISQSVNVKPDDDEPPPGEPEVYVFRKKTAVFGYNAPKKVKYKGDTPVNPVDWEDWTNDEQPGVVYLDAAYEEILPESFIAIQNPVNKAKPLGFYQVATADVTSRTAYNISTKTTALSLTVKDAWYDTVITDLEAIRSITVYAQSERLRLSELPIQDDIKGKIIMLGRYYPGLKPGQPIALNGERSDLNGIYTSELAILDDVTIEDGLTILYLSNDLKYEYKPRTVTINANVAEATHGETVQEVLGSGDATQSFQQFTLKQPPLTYIGSNSPSGNQTTLEIRVNDLLWKEVGYFLDHGSDEHIYITRLDNEGKTTVIFGDGVNGARLPTGQANVKARYRKGIGSGGTVKANQLSQLMTMPLGVKSAVNPVAASGAQNPEKLEAAKSNASLTILTLGRIVSLQDYEDFSRAFAGIGKALATWTRKNQRQHIYITVGAAEGAVVPEGSKLHTRLLEAIRLAGSEQVSVKVESYVPAFFQVVADLQVDPTFLPETVLAAVEKNLRACFSFEQRKFGQPVTYSEVVAGIQRTKGVTAVDINYLFRSDQSSPTLEYLLACRMPTADAAAELLTLDPRPVQLNILP
jgi:predicted phage baseplate assembly protein